MISPNLEFFGWETQGLCADAPDPDAWFPGRGESIDEPVATCQDCPVKRQCLDKALAQPASEDRGVWGATSERQRRHMRAGQLTAEQAWADMRDGKRKAPAHILASTKALRERTHCIRGHEYTPKNTRLDPDGARVCRACKAEQGRAWRARKAAQEAA